MNEHELIFFKDSYYKGKSIPDMLKVLFKQKIIVPRDFEEDEIAENTNIELGGVLVNAIIYDEAYNNIQQQEDGYDCGWWAVYNSFMFVMEGSGDFLIQFKNPSRDLGYKLRKILIDFQIKLEGPAVELNLKITLIEQLKQKDSKIFGALSDTIQG